MDFGKNSPQDKDKSLRVTTPYTLGNYSEHNLLKERS